MDLISQIVERAKANKQRIVLPEGTEERTLKAANQILTDGVADLILLGNPDEIMSLAKQWGLGNIGKATIIDPTDHPKKEEYAQLLCELRKKKGMTIEEARKLVVDPRLKFPSLRFIARSMALRSNCSKFSISSVFTLFSGCGCNMKFAGFNNGESERIIARSMACCNSRTLPGQW